MATSDSRALRLGLLLALAAPAALAQARPTAAQPPAAQPTAAQVPPAAGRPGAAPLTPAVILAPLPPALQLPPQPPEEAGVTESDLLQYWLSHSREVAAWRTAIGAARFDIVTARLWPNPSLQVNFLGTFVGPPPDSPTNYGVQWTQALPIFGQVAGRIESAMAALRVQEVSVAVQLWQRATELEQAMVDRAFAEARARMVRLNLGELERIEAVIQQRVSMGANSRYDQLRVTSARITLEAALADATAERTRAETRLVAAIADPGLTAAPIGRPGLAGFRGPEDVEQLVRYALAQRADLELLRRGVRLSESNVQRLRREVNPIPSVSLGAYLGANPANFNGGPSYATLSGSITAAVSITLPAIDRNQGLIGRATTEADGLRLLQASLTERIEREVRGAWAARQQAREALTRYNDLHRPVVDELVQRALATYQLGTASNFGIVELVDAFQTRWDAREQRLQLERTFADAEVDLERASAILFPMSAATAAPPPAANPPPAPPPPPAQ